MSDTTPWPQTDYVTRFEYMAKDGRCPADNACNGGPCPEPMLCAIDRAAKYLGDARYVVIDRHGYTARAHTAGGGDE